MEELVGYILFVIVGIVTVLVQIVKQRQESAEKPTRKAGPPPLPQAFADSDETAQTDRAQESRELEWARKVERAKLKREEREREREREQRRQKEREQRKARNRNEPPPRRDISLPLAMTVVEPLVVIPIPEPPVVAELLEVKPISPLPGIVTKIGTTSPVLASPNAKKTSKALDRVGEMLADRSSLQAALMLREILDPPLSKRKR